MHHVLGIKQPISRRTPVIDEPRIVVIPVLENLKKATTDERMLEVINRTQGNLQNILDGKPVENPFNRGGGRGNRGGGGTPGTQTN